MYRSRYSPIWDKLKELGECRITATPALHPRLIKAVIKRKDVDIAYKHTLLSEPVPKKSRLSYEINGGVITFRLNKYIPYSSL
jgi:hypothetical protein